MSRDPAMIPRDGADAARMGISASRNPHAPDSKAYHTWHADYHCEMGRRSANAKQAEKYRKIADRYRMMADNAAIFEITEGGQ